MALQVWLPLLGNLDNQGLSDLRFSLVSGSPISVDASGKIGSCYKNTANTGGIVSDKTIDLGQNQSMFCWFKFTSLTSASSLGGCAVSQHRHSNNSGMGITIKYVSQTTGYLSVNTGTKTGRTYNTYTGTTLLQANTWYHGGYTFDGSTIRIYLNGKLEKEHAFSGMYVPADYLMVFCWSLNGSTGSAIYEAYHLIGSVNDVRIYDHCLSDKEVKEISKGLVMHYPLNDPYIGNLIPNGYAREGAKDWESAPKTDDKPSVSGCAGYFNGATSSEYVPIFRDHVYTTNEYIKTAGATSGYNYPAFLPYDYDKKFIANYNSYVGFNSATKTTLSKPLNPGDKIVYATDLSKWSNSTTNHYYFVAVFGYEDSSGFVYPDMTYTADSLSFGSQTDKSNLDIAGNKITLLSAYTGKARPAGTTICQATAGSTYWYPHGAVTYASIADWTFKSRTFVPANDGRLTYAAYMRYYAYPNAKHAAISLVDNTIGTGVVVDASGYHRDGAAYNAVSFSKSNDRMRYDCSTDFDGEVNAIKVPFDATAWQDKFTLNLWFKKTKLGSKNYETLFGGPSGFEMDTRAGSSTTLSLYMTSTRGSTLWSPFALNTWYMVTLVNDGTNELYYVNGDLKKTIEKKAMPSGDYYIGSWNGTDKQNYCGAICDFRVYATPLSKEDIVELHQTGASVDKKLNLHAYDFYEEVASENLFGDVEIASISKNGTIVDVNGTKGVRWDFTNQVDTYVMIKMAKALVSSKTYWLSFDCEGVGASDNINFGVPQAGTYANFKLHNGRNVVKVSGLSLAVGGTFGIDDWSRSSSSVVTCSNFYISDVVTIPEINKTGIVDAREFSDGVTHTASVYVNGDVSGKELIET